MEEVIVIIGAAVSVMGCVALVGWLLAKCVN